MSSIPAAELREPQFSIPNQLERLVGECLPIAVVKDAHSCRLDEALDADRSRNGGESASECVADLSFQASAEAKWCHEGAGSIDERVEVFNEAELLDPRIEFKRFEPAARDRQ